MLVKGWDSPFGEVITEGGQNSLKWDCIGEELMEGFNGLGEFGPLIPWWGIWGPELKALRLREGGFKIRVGTLPGKF